MRNKLFHLLSISALIAFATIIAGCSQSPSSKPSLIHISTPTPTFKAIPGLISPTPTTTPTPTVTPTPTPTFKAIPGPIVPLYEQNFEASPLQGIYADDSWSVSLDGPTNHIFCNQVSDDWNVFKFGYENWTNYAVEMQVKLVEQNTDLSAEIYARINDSTEGYRGQLFRTQVRLAYISPVEDLGGTSFPTEANRWYVLRIEVAGNQVKFFIDDQLIVSVSDSNQSHRNTGMGGFGLSSGTQACVDDIRAWALTSDGQIALQAPQDQVVKEGSLSQYEGDCTFCFVDGSDPSMPVWGHSTGGWEPRARDTRQRITKDETFSVPANQVTTFDDQIILIQPKQRHDIHVYGTLIIKNSLLLWQQTEYQQTGLIIEKGGKLDIENSYAFSSNQFWFKWTFNDGSTVSFDHFVGLPWTGMWGSAHYTAKNFSTVDLTVFGDVNNTGIEISNAHHVEFEFVPPPGTYEFSLLKMQQWTGWDIPNIWPNTDLHMTQSYLYARNVSLNPDVHVTITDTLDGFSVGWGIHKDTPGFVEDCEITGLGVPGNDQGVLYKNATWDLPCINSSLTVVNSVLLTSWPNTYGYVHLKVYDSNLYDLRNYGPPSTYEIYRSSIDNVAAYNGGLIYIENSTVRTFIEVNGKGSIVYGYDVTMEPGSQIMTPNGGQYIELKTPGPPWRFVPLPISAPTSTFTPVP